MQRRVGTLDWTRERTTRLPLDRLRVVATSAVLLLSAHVCGKGWEERCDDAGRTYFVDHTSQMTTFLDPRLPANKQRTIGRRGSFRPPKYIFDLSAKVALVQSKLAQEQTTDFALRVRRDELVHDSREQIESVGTWALRQRLRIEFANEAGKDYGGMSREWFLLLSQDLALPERRLFTRCDGYRLALNPDTKDVQMVRFVGLVCGMAVYHGMIVQLAFVPLLYKYLLGYGQHDWEEESITTLDELRAIDAGLAKSLQWILDNDVTVLELTMVTQDTGLPLVEGGETVPVTNDNKAEYVAHTVKHRLVGCVANHLEAFVSGFREMVPLSVLEGLQWSELELLLGGQQQIDVEDWRANTVYTGSLDADSDLVAVLWRTVADMSQADRALLLRFVTGTDRLPIGGFAALHGSNGPCKFTVTCLDHRWEGLPSAHTCFNRLELPRYGDANMLEGALVTAMRECVGRFDME